MTVFESQPAWKPVVVAPTYNNAATLGGVIAGVINLDLPVIVVNDGCTDDTADVLRAVAADHPDATLVTLTHDTNRGKAAALRTGMRHAGTLGYTHALTIDTDGQHDPADLPALVAAAKADPAALVLGVRDGGAAAAPARNRVGRAVSDWLVSKVARRPIADSQTGLRVYPLDLMDQLDCRAERYAFETEVVVRAAWAGRPILQAPVPVRYAPRGERVSHFRPVIDSARCVRLMLGLLWESRRAGADRADPSTYRLSDPSTGYKMSHS